MVVLSPCLWAMACCSLKMSSDSVSSAWRPMSSSLPWPVTFSAYSGTSSGRWTTLSTNSDMDLPPRSLERTPRRPWLPGRRGGSERGRARRSPERSARAGPGPDRLALALRGRELGHLAPDLLGHLVDLGGLELLRQLRERVVHVGHRAH